jgi:hypothetical protein
VGPGPASRRPFYLRWGPLSKTMNSQEQTKTPPPWLDNHAPIKSWTDELDEDARESLSHAMEKED